MDYDLYHDESQEEGYWHGMLLVPKSTRDIFLEYLELIRAETGYPSPVFLKGLNNKGRRFDCIKSWLQLGTGSLMQYFKNEPYIVSVDERKYSDESRSLHKNYKELLKIDSDNKIIGAKFILFKERDSHSMMGIGYPDFASKIETTFRMGMTGGIHWLGGQESPIKIKSIHFDGYEHYGRNIDKKRIVDRIYGLRDYCLFEENVPIDDRTSRHDRNTCQNYDDCQFLQLTDLLVSSFRTVLGVSKNKTQEEVAFPVKQVIIKWQDGYHRIKNSRWFKGFWISECWIENDKWNFGDFRYKNTKQNKLI